MKKFFLCLTFIFISEVLCFAQGLIVDHKCTNIQAIPKWAVRKAKGLFRVTYGHTSHGSQIVSGMNALKNKNPLYNFYDDYYFYRFNNPEFKLPADALSFWDKKPGGDLGNPDRKRWADRTRSFLQGLGKSRNLVMWSWCGQVSSASEQDINTYLELMNKLEGEFPAVTFVYMTGHLDGSGGNGNLNRRNEQIREFCRRNNKVLFDFADIESYDPGGRINFMKLYAGDNCDYRQHGRRRNWADDWLNENPRHDFALPGQAAHTKPLNAAMKGNAFWWMLARLSGWTPAGSPRFDKTQAPPSVKPVSSSQSAPKADSELPGKNSAERTFRFNEISDYRNWQPVGTGEPVIPEHGRGLEIPKGGHPAAVLHRTRFALEELQFRARLEEGSHINWFANCDWNGSWKPAAGISGVINRDGCILVLNGNACRIKNAPRIDLNEHLYQVEIKNGRLIWGMDGKVIVDRELPDNLADRRGRSGIGAWDSKARISGIYLRAH